MGSHSLFHCPPGLVVSRGMCRRCYNHAYRKGMLDVNTYRRPTHEYFFEKVNASGCCWEWTANLDRDGYGKFCITDGKTWRAHRWCWEYLVGPIPEGMQLDHLCRNKRCVMPDHLEVVTNAENMRRRYALLSKTLGAG